MNVTELIELGMKDCEEIDSQFLLSGPISEKNVSSLSQNVPHQGYVFLEKVQSLNTLFKKFSIFYRD